MLNTCKWRYQHNAPKLQGFYLGDLYRNGQMGYWGPKIRSSLLYTHKNTQSVVHEILYLYMFFMIRTHLGPR